jgi:hypothetical protein
MTWYFGIVYNSLLHIPPAKIHLYGISCFSIILKFKSVIHTRAILKKCAASSKLH